MRRVLLLLSLSLLPLLSACGSPRPIGLLSSKAPDDSRRVQNAARVTDGVVPRTGDVWDSELAAVMSRSGAALRWDLGREVAIDAVILVGDNNDRFYVEGSLDGKSFSRIFTAAPVPGAGMRMRTGRGLGKRARHVRLRAIGGDRGVSVGELMLFSATPATFPPKLHYASGRGGDERPLELLLGMLALLSAFAALSDRRLPKALSSGAWLLLAGGLACLGVALYRYYPLQLREIGILRLAVAGSALACVARLWRSEHALAWRVDALLWVLAVVGVACFHNLGQPQFPDARVGDKTRVHTYDMRVYFPVAKYFESLRFDGLYFASVAAYEDGAGRSEASTSGVRLRDLRTNQMTTAAEVRDEIRAVRKRFSPERWEEFKRDMRYFWTVMGPGGYLGSLRDHGGNATPPWLMVARGLFSNTTASDAVLLATGLLDPLLILLMLIAIARSFGVRTMLVCAIAYGTTDFPQYTSNWDGATLRSDWMAYLGLGLSALRVGRPTLGGSLLAASAMARAFPAFAVIFLPVPAALWWLRRWRAGSAPGLRGLLSAQAPLVRATVGATLTVVVLAVASGATLGFREGWGGWIDKITMHAEKPNINHVGLRNVAAYDPALTASRSGNWVATQRQTLQRRAPLYYGAMAGFVALLLLAAVGRSLRQAALLGLMLIPIVLYPANYYLHCVFLFPMLADARRGERESGAFFWVSAVLLAMSCAQYPGYRMGWSDVRYTESSVILLAGLLLIMGPLALQGLRRLRRPPAAEPGPEPEPT